MAATMLASQSRPLWRMIQEYRLDGDALFRQVGLDHALMEQPRARFPVAKVFSLWAEVVRQTGHPHITLQITRYMKIPDFHSLAIAFLSSGRLREGLRRLIRFQKVANTSIEMSLQESDGKFHLLVQPFNLPGINEALVEDTRSAVVLELCRMAADGDLNPASVGFA